jgi:hypothetical protein
MVDESVQLTMLIVSHRTSTLKDVGKIVGYDRGPLVNDLSYA